MILLRVFNKKKHKKNTLQSSFHFKLMTTYNENKNKTD